MPDWPPQPDRVFSALVAAWAARGGRLDEREALEWLEAQSAPSIRAAEAAPRTAPDVFVPPNDSRSSSASRTYLRVLPERRPRQPRRFPAVRPDEPVMEVVWSAEPEPPVVAALDAIARDVAYVGHSASLTRCRFRSAEVEGPPGRPATRRVYPCRLAELERAYAANPVRPVIREGAAVPADVAPAPARTSGDWLVLEALPGGAVPDIRGAALVCRQIRRAIMSGYERAGSGEEIPEEISGHTADGAPTKEPHVAIQPMAFAGFPHADGRVFGFALIPPRGTVLLEIPGLLQAFEAIAPFDPGEERRVLALRGGPLPDDLRMAPTGPGAKRSLSSAPYIERARVWASVTPIVLDRHLKGKEENEVGQLIARACENAGLPRPDVERIQTGKHSAVEGTPPARPLRGAPAWSGWRLPEQLRSRSLTHAVIDFGDEVGGPVMLGAGRFTGLGLCRGVR